MKIKIKYGTYSKLNTPGKEIELPVFDFGFVSLTFIDLKGDRQNAVLPIHEISGIEITATEAECERAKQLFMEQLQEVHRITGKMPPAMYPPEAAKS